MNTNRHKIQVEAENDAQTDTHKLLWVIVGAALSVFGLLAAYIYQQNPPLSRTYGMDDEETYLYTDAYKAKSRQIQLSSAFIGFIISILFYVFLIIAFFSIFFTTQSEIIKGFERTRPW